MHDLQFIKKRYLPGRHMWYDRQNLGLTSILKNRRRQRRRAAIIGVLSGLGNYKDFFEKYVSWKSRKITHCAETLAPQTQITLSTMVESSLESSKRFILQRYLAPGKFVWSMYFVEKCSMFFYQNIFFSTNMFLLCIKRIHSEDKTKWFYGYLQWEKKFFVVEWR